MKKLSYFDLHCDTLYERFMRPSTPKHLDCEGDFLKRKQIYAVWSDHKLTHDVMYENFFGIAKLLPEGGRLAVEGGELLGDDITRLDALSAYDLAYFTLVWADSCPIGGAWNTDEGLTDFGAAVVRRLLELDITPDVSHASERMFWDVAALTDRFIATHSNSRAVCDHRRNLTDEQFCHIRDKGGVVGISMCPHHLSEKGSADQTDVMRHIEHYMSLGGEGTVCLGCDFDGITETPEGLGSPAELYKLADEMAKAGYGDSLINAVFYENANNYFKGN